MNQRRPVAHSYLFTVRVWWEDLGQGQREWRGVVKLVTSGEEDFFRDWATLGELIERMMPDLLTESALWQEQELLGPAQNRLLTVNNGAEPTSVEIVS